MQETSWQCKHANIKSRITDLAGTNLPVDICLLSDAILQVWDVGLQPVPVANDGGSLHRVAALRPIPSEGRRNTQISLAKNK